MFNRSNTIYNNNNKKKEKKSSWARSSEGCCYVIGRLEEMAVAVAVAAWTFWRSKTGGEG